ncbi:potassium voltage-gated channel subfamily E member 3 [Tachyglossus aculeatus]|uniref:potassium voltage-gated channel subfamily E member 3 n=1 Tax=Tachyglossus aculeatus TaxID=9261 RepID=UPI0018F6564D|nr:potassium voltage-gated channel subfamily E member 3 [Tachyglossus aculeatus]
METSNRTAAWSRGLHWIVKALNETLHGPPPPSCQPRGNQPEPGPATGLGRDDNSYIYVLFVMFFFAVTVGGLVLGYTRSRKADKLSDPYHVYIKNRGPVI